ncbi:MAG: molybdopterin-dependent oxidoreductase, partial [bacterium]|nr:molybdopterin-dependent oxidoreductase [bacterium]
ARSRQIETPDYNKSIGKDKFTVYSLYCGGEPHASLLPKSIIDGDPYKIRSMFIMGASLLTSWPNPDLWRKALAKLDFLVTIDLQFTEDAAYADIVLPATTAFEQESYCYYGSSIRFREKMIEPVGEARPNYYILAELAKRLGYGHLYPQNQEELLEYIMSESGFTVKELMQADKHVLNNSRKKTAYRKWEKGLLRMDGKPGFETPSGKFEIKSTILEKYGYAGLPKYEESIETP